MAGHEKYMTPSLFQEGDDEVSLSSGDFYPPMPLDYVPEILPAIGKKLNIQVNKERTEEVLGALLHALDANESPYNLDRARVAQDPRHMPRTLERGGVEHAMFWFNSCNYMRGSIQSNTAIPGLASLYDEWPELFDASTASSLDPAQLEEILPTYGLGRGRAAVSRHWVENSRRLMGRFEGDPRNIFQGVSTYDQSLALIQNDKKGGGFIGFQEKMVSMIIYYLMAEDLIENRFNFPIPVDFHAMRVSIANEMITFPDAPFGTNFYTDETTAVLRKLYADYAEEHGVSPLKVCDAVWLLSQSLCNRNPGNRTNTLKVRDAEGGIKTLLTPYVVDKNNPADAAAYRASCGQCPLESMCRYDMPSASYYSKEDGRRGGIFIRGERQRFPLLALAEQMPLVTSVEQ